MDADKLSHQDHVASNSHGEDKSFNYSAVIVPETLIFLDEAVVTIMKFRTSKKMEAKVPGGCRGKISAGIQVPL